MSRSTAFGFKVFKKCSFDKYFFFKIIIMEYGYPNTQNFMQSSNWKKIKGRKEHFYLSIKAIQKFNFLIIYRQFLFFLTVKVFCVFFYKSDIRIKFCVFAIVFLKKLSFSQIYFFASFEAKCGGNGVKKTYNRFLWTCLRITFATFPWSA
jgi:hypothetical protein